MIQQTKQTFLAMLTSIGVGSYTLDNVQFENPTNELLTKLLIPIVTGVFAPMIQSLFAEWIENIKLRRKIKESELLEKKEVKKLTATKTGKNVTI